MSAAAMNQLDAITHVVIVTHNGLGCIDDCLRSLNTEPGLVVHVVDNASSDGTAARVAAAYPWVKLTRLQRNLGFGLGNNHGIRAALREGARFVLLLNQDTVVPAGAIAVLSRFLMGHPQYAACSPLQCTPDLARPDPKTLAHYLSPHAQPYLADLVAGQVRSHYRVHGLNAAVWLVRADTFRRAGGFSPLFFMYGEDDELLARWRHHDLAFALVPTVRVAHSRYRPPPAPDAPTKESLTRIANWAHSRLLLQVLGPGHGAWFMTKVLLLRGFLQPLLDALVDHDGRRALGWWWATLRLLCRMPALRRHAALTARAGAHFLGPAGAPLAEAESPSPVIPSSYPC